MKSSSFIGHLYRSFLAVHGPTLSLVALALSVGGWFWIPATSQMDGRYFAILALLAAIVFPILVHSSYTALAESKRILPSVLHTQEPPKIYKNALALLLLENSPLFTYDSFVSIYLLENEMESFLGIGQVINIQEDEKIQILALADSGHPERWEEIKKANKATISKIRIKPSIPSSFKNILDSQN